MPKVTIGAGHSWFIEEGGTRIATFQSMSGLGATTEYTPIRLTSESGLSYIYEVTRGLTFFTGFTLSGVLTDNTYLWDWVKQLYDGQFDEGFQRDLVLTMTAADGTTVIAKFAISKAWPTAYAGPSLDMNGGAAHALETLSFVIASFHREQ